MTIEDTPQCDKITREEFGVYRQRKNYGEIAAKGTDHSAYDDDESIRFSEDPAT